MVDSKLTGTIMCKNYKFGKKLGSGAFGDIYLVSHKTTNEEYAAKVEKADTRHPQIQFEAKLYNYLHSDSNIDNGLPRIYYQGVD